MMRTYGTIRHSSAQWFIEHAEPHVCIRLKNIFPKLAKAATNFIFPDIPESCHDLLWFMERYPLAVSEKDLQRLKKGKKQHLANINDLEQIMLPAYVPVQAVLNNNEKARDYQLRGNQVYLKCGRLLIGDDIGLGKTLIAILSFLETKTLPAVVVVQTHLQTQWKQEIEWFTNLRVHCITKRTAYSLPPADVYVIKYSCLIGWVDVFRKGVHKSCVFDEVQELRRQESDKYKAAAVLAENARYCLGLSATPIYNYGDEIFNVLNVIKRGALGQRDDFLREWTTGWKTVKDPQALGTYLREQFLFLRRTRAEVGRQMPPVNKIVHTVAYDEAEMQKADELARILAIKTTTGNFIERGQAARDLDILVRHNTGVAKARGVAEYVKLLLENNEPVLLAAWHRDVYEIWLTELAEYKPLLYTGSESAAQKNATKDAFLAGETNLMIISLRSGAGLDGLQARCKTVVFGELDWSPKVHEQMIGRVDRDGQAEQVMAVFLVTDCGSDPPMVDLLGLKSSQSHGIVDPLLAVPEQHSDESRIKLLAQQYLIKKQKELV